MLVCCAEIKFESERSFEVSVGDNAVDISHDHTHVSTSAARFTTDTTVIQEGV